MTLLNIFMNNFKEFLWNKKIEFETPENKEGNTENYQSKKKFTFVISC